MWCRCLYTRNACTALRTRGDVCTCPPCALQATYDASHIDYDKELRHLGIQTLLGAPTLMTPVISMTGESCKQPTRGPMRHSV